MTNLEKAEILKTWVGRVVTVHFVGRQDEFGNEQYAWTGNGVLQKCHKDYITLHVDVSGTYETSFLRNFDWETLYPGSQIHVVPSTKEMKFSVPLKHVGLKTVEDNKGLKIEIVRAFWEKPNDRKKTTRVPSPISHKYQSHRDTGILMVGFLFLCGGIYALVSHEIFWPAMIHSKEIKIPVSGLMKEVIGFILLIAGPFLIWWSKRN